MESNFRQKVEKNLQISLMLQAEPWRLEELDRDPEVLSAVIAYHADYHPGSGMIGVLRQPSCVREALRGVLDVELTRRSARAQMWLTWAGFSVSLAGFAITGVQLWSMVFKST